MALLLAVITTALFSLIGFLVVAAVTGLISANVRNWRTDMAGITFWFVARTNCAGSASVAYGGSGPY